MKIARLAHDAGTPIVECPALRTDLAQRERGPGFPTPLAALPH